MCKSSEPPCRPSTVISSNIEQPTPCVQTSPISLPSAPCGLKVKNTFLDFQIPSSSFCDIEAGSMECVTFSRKRAVSEPAHARAGLPQEEESDEEEESDASTGLPQEEESDDSWAATPQSSPRASGDSIVPAQSRLRLLECVIAGDAEAICSRVDCLPSDIKFLARTPQWANECQGQEQLKRFLRQFIAAFPDLSVSLSDITSSQRPGGEHSTFRANCSGTQHFPFLSMFQAHHHINFTWDASSMKDEDGKITLIEWNFTPVGHNGGQTVNLPQGFQMEMSPQVPMGMVGLCVPALPWLSLAQPAAPMCRSRGNVAENVDQANEAVANLLLQAQRAKLAAASLRALDSLATSETQQSATRDRDSRRSQLPKLHRISTFHAEPSVGCAQRDRQTTVILRNIPVEYTRRMLLEMLDAEGFAGTYDFLYMPRDFQRSFGLGYAFVNFVTSEDALEAQQRLNGFCSWEIPSQKMCEVGWSDRHQGLSAQIERYRDSPVMHHSVPDEYRPVLFQQGVRMQFPAPTRSVKPPREFQYAQ